MCRYSVSIPTKELWKDIHSKTATCCIPFQAWRLLFLFPYLSSISVANPCLRKPFLLKTSPNWKSYSQYPFRCLFHPQRSPCLLQRHVKGSSGCQTLRDQRRLLTVIIEQKLFLQLCELCMILMGHLCYKGNINFNFSNSIPPWLTDKLGIVSYLINSLIIPCEFVCCAFLSRCVCGKLF